MSKIYGVLTIFVFKILKKQVRQTLNSKKEKENNGEGADQIISRYLELNSLIMLNLSKLRWLYLLYLLLGCISLPGALFISMFINRVCANRFRVRVRKYIC